MHALSKRGPNCRHDQEHISSAGQRCFSTWTHEPMTDLHGIHLFASKKRGVHLDFLLDASTIISCSVRLHKLQLGIRDASKAATPASSSREQVWLSQERAVRLRAVRLRGSFSLKTVRPRRVECDTRGCTRHEVDATRYCCRTSLP